MASKIGIIGLGWVGKAMLSVFPDAVVCDKGDSFNELNKCAIAFVCVPTPLENGKLDVSIVEEVVNQCECDLIVIRSTVSVGTCERLDRLGKNIVFQPEYLGETVAHPLLKEGDRKFLIIGGRPENRRKLIELYHKVYNANINIRQVSNTEAEVIKLSENRAIAFKIAQCQELYDACQKNGVDYYTIRDAVYGDDPRLNLWFTFVYPERRGFQSKCLPKDVYGWLDWAKTDLTKELLAYNERLICSQ